MVFEKIVECVPNFSEGRDEYVIEKIANAFNADGVKLLDYSADVDHNRSVFTVAGRPESLAETVLNAVGVAKDCIDLTEQSGQHPRIGAADVIPFVPIKNVTVEETVALSRYVGEQIAVRYDIPVYLYEQSATSPLRVNLADIRKGQFEGLNDKMKLKEWQPDFGSAKPHPTAGASVVGCRPFLVAFNVNLDTPNVEVAKKIAKRVRFINGGLRFVKALGVRLDSRDAAQVTMNITDYTRTPLYLAFELVKLEAARYGVNVVGTEIIGLLPQKALLDCAEYYLRIENFSSDKVLENKLN